MWYVLLSLVVLALAGYVAATLYLFKASVRRWDKPKDIASPRSTWRPYTAAMQKAQAWLRGHTTETVEIRSHDGLRLRALLVEHENPKGTVVALHGFHSAPTVDFAPQAEFLWNLGYNVLLPWQRAHGESEGRFITYGEAERYDVQAWAAFAAQRFGEERDVFLAGISMGCASVLLATGLALPPNVRGVVADCGYTTPYEVMRHTARKRRVPPAFLGMFHHLCRKRVGLGAKDLSVPRVLAGNRLPVLFIHGDADPTVPLWMTQRNHAAQLGERELFVVRGATHATAYLADPDGYSRHVAVFFKKYGKSA